MNILERHLRKSRESRRRSRIELTGPRPRLLSLLSVATALALVLLATEARSGSLIVEHLATVCEVEVQVVDGRLLFEPIPGLKRASLDQLRAELTSRIESALTDAGFAVVEGAATAIVL